MNKASEFLTLGEKLKVIGMQGKAMNGSPQPKQNTAPPVGLTPQYIVDLKRANEIREAILRYLNHAEPLAIPTEWVEEYNMLVAKEKNRKASAAPVEEKKEAVGEVLHPFDQMNKDMVKRWLLMIPKTLNNKRVFMGIQPIVDCEDHLDMFDEVKKERELYFKEREPVNNATKLPDYTKMHNDLVEDMKKFANEKIGFHHNPKNIITMDRVSNLIQDYKNKAKMEEIPPLFTKEEIKQMIREETGATDDQLDGMDICIINLNGLL